MTTDCFGRERHREDRQDMGGVGSMFRANQTLYVNLGGATSYGRERLQEMVRRTFGQFGSIEKLSVKLEKGIAFVTYDIRASAEFAKECMSSQSLLGSTMSEILDVRWSYDDGNPVAVTKRKREAQGELASAIQHTIVQQDCNKKPAGVQEPATVEGEDDINRYDFDDDPYYDLPSEVGDEEEEEAVEPSGKEDADQTDEKPQAPATNVAVRTESEPAKEEEKPEANALGLLGLADYGSDSED
jgi:hypothetical protein